MRLQFRTVFEPRPGDRWRALFDRSWPAYREWFLREGNEARPGVEASRQMLRSYMPELEPLWDELTALSGGDEQVARMLSLVNPTPYISGCSQAVWTGETPFLIRNYDYHPLMCEGMFLMSAWTGTRVIASSDCLWGALDGLNEHGVCASLSFGGRTIVGEGFGIPLIVRYILEVSRNTREAVAHLSRIPCNMAYNISVLDRLGEYVVVSLAPDRPPQISQTAVATNHQDADEWIHHESYSRSRERERSLERLLTDRSAGPDDLVESFLDPPLFSDEYSRGFGTLYTARYDPGVGRATFLWPGRRTVHSFDSFEEDRWLIDYDEPLFAAARRAS